MRVLFCPQIYTKHDYIEGNSTITDMIYWADAWLDQDPHVHIYWLLPRQQDVDYDDDTFNLDHGRVTAFKHRGYNQGTPYSRVDGYREAELQALADEIKDHYGYFDVVIEQNGERQNTLWKYLNEAQGYAYSQQPPFQLIRHVHDFNAPWKDHVERFRGDHMLTADLKSMVDANRIWLRSEWDREEIKRAARDYLAFDAISTIDEEMLYVDTPIDFGDLHFGAFHDRPEYIHLAGTPNIGKKNRDLVVEIAEQLYARYGIELLITSMATIEKKFKEKPFVTAYDNCSWDQYTDILAKGDICICPTEYETGGKTWFEQAASGQVFVVWDQPWVSEYLDGYKLATGSKSNLLKLTLWAINNWDEATDATEAFMERIKERRSPSTIGETTLEDCRALTEETVAGYELKWDEEVLTQTMEYLRQRPAPIDKIDDATARFTDTEKPITDLFGYTTIDLVHALRTMGYVDVGGRTPAFKEAE